MMYRAGMDVSYPKCPLPDEEVYIRWGGRGAYLFILNRSATDPGTFCPPTVPILMLELLDQRSQLNRGK